jgi:hypothetical protein
MNIRQDATAEARKEYTERRTFFDVEKIKGGDGKYYIQGNGDAKISQVSDRYTLIPNRSLIQPIAEHFGWDKLVAITKWGNNFSYKFETGREIEIDDGDRVKEQLLIGNSYDKSKSFSFMFGAFRMVCSNGMYTGQAVVAYKKIHIGNIPVESLVNKVINNYQSNSFDLWRDFANKPLTLSEQMELSDNFKAYVEPKEDKHQEYRHTYHEPKDNIYLNRIIKEKTHYYLNRHDSVDNSRNAWGLYNQINRAIAHTPALKAPSQEPKRVLGNLNAEKYLAEVIK